VAEQDRGSDDPQLGAIARHALHDEELIAAYAAGDVDDPADAARARSLVERCPTCRELHADVSLIRATIQASGSAAERAATLAAPRDFRLTAEVAARLRPGTPIARLAAQLGWRARLSVGIASFRRPIGAALATFGIAGLLVGSLTLSGTPLASTTGAGAASSAPGAEQIGPAPETSVDRANFGPLATTKDTRTQAEPAGRVLGADVPGLLLAGGSVLLFFLGIALIVTGGRGRGGIPERRGN
jgi:hypothetical protein